MPLLCTVCILGAEGLKCGTTHITHTVPLHPQVLCVFPSLSLWMMGPFKHPTGPSLLPNLRCAEARGAEDRLNDKRGDCSTGDYSQREGSIVVWHVHAASSGANWNSSQLCLPGSRLCVFINWCAVPCTVKATLAVSICSVRWGAIAAYANMCKLVPAVQATEQGSCPQLQLGLVQWGCAVRAITPSPGLLLTGAQSSAAQNWLWKQHKVERIAACPETSPEFAEQYSFAIHFASSFQAQVWFSCQSYHRVQQSPEEMRMNYLRRVSLAARMFSDIRRSCPPPSRVFIHHVSYIWKIII